MTFFESFFRLARGLEVRTLIVSFRCVKYKKTTDNITMSKKINFLCIRKLVDYREDIHACE